MHVRASRGSSVPNVDNFNGETVGLESRRRQQEVQTPVEAVVKRQISENFIQLAKNLFLLLRFYFIAYYFADFP